MEQTTDVQTDQIPQQEEQVQNKYDSVLKPVQVEQQNNAEVMGITTNGDVYQNFGSDLLRLSKMIMDINLTDKDYSYRNKIHSVIDRPAYESCLNMLLENNLLLIACNKKWNTVRLAFEMLCDKNFHGATGKQISFQKEFSMEDLVDKIHEDKELKEKSLFIIGDLTGYGSYPVQKQFLDAIKQQLHTNTMAVMKNNKWYMVLLVSEETALSIRAAETVENLKVWIQDGDGDEREKMPDVDILFKNANHIEKLLLFTAAGFDNLSLRQFDYIIGLLLSKSAKNDSIAIERFKNFAEGAKKVKEVLSDELPAIWQSHKETFFDNCFLEAKNDGGLYTVGFCHPNLKNNVRSYFKKKHHFFWQTQCSILEQERLVFNATVNPAIADGIVDLIVESMVDDQEYYDEFWFIDIITDIQDRDGQKYELRGETPTEQLGHLFTDMSHRRELINFFYSRLGSILKKMVLNKLNSKVDDFLESLIRPDLHSHLLVLIKIVGVLKEFDKFLWLKELINRGENKTKNEAYNWMVYSLSVRQPEETWAAIKSWLPTEKRISKFSHSNHYALFFVIHYYVNEINRFPIAKYGNSAHEFPLFNEPENKSGAAFENIEFFVTQALKEGTEFQFSGTDTRVIQLMLLSLFVLNWDTKEEIKKLVDFDTDSEFVGFDKFTNANYTTLLADIIECFFNILIGFSNTSPQSQQLIKHLFQTLFRELKNKPGKLNDMIGHWQKKPGFYRRQQDKIREYKKLNDDDIGPIGRKHLDQFMMSLNYRTQNLQNLFEEINKYL